MKCLFVLLVTSSTLCAQLSTANAQSPNLWKGIYAGAYVGGDWNNLGHGATDFFGSTTALPTGLAAGGLLGLNLTSGVFVYGLETDVALPDLADAPDCSDLSFCWQDVGREIVGSVRARAGFALNRALVYGTAGYAFSDLANGSLARPDAAPTVFHNGWTVGAGMEFSLGDHLRTGLEYRSTIYDRRSADDTFNPAYPPRSNEISIRLTFH